MAGLGEGALVAFAGDLTSLATLVNHFTIVSSAALVPSIMDSAVYQEATNYFDALGAAGKHALNNIDKFPAAIKAWLKAKDKIFLSALAVGDRYTAGKVQGEIAYRIITTYYVGYGAVRVIYKNFPKIKAKANAVAASIATSRTGNTKSLLLAQAKQLKTLGVDKASRRAFFSGEEVMGYIKTMKGATADLLFQLNGNTLTAQLFHISNNGNKGAGMGAMLQFKSK